MSSYSFPIKSLVLLSHTPLLPLPLPLPSLVPVPNPPTWPQPHSPPSTPIPWLLYNGVVVFVVALWWWKDYSSSDLLGIRLFIVSFPTSSSPSTQSFVVYIYLTLFSSSSLSVSCVSLYRILFIVLIFFFWLVMEYLRTNNHIDSSGHTRHANASLPSVGDGKPTILVPQAHPLHSSQVAKDAMLFFFFFCRCCCFFCPWTDCKEWTWVTALVICNVVPWLHTPSS